MTTRLSLRIPFLSLHRRSPVLLALVAAMMLFGMVFTSEASAVQSGESCEIGTLVDGQCEIEGDAPTTGPSTCPVDAAGDPGSCYIESLPTPTCPPGAAVSEDPTNCLILVPDVPGEFGCSDGYELDGERCIARYAPVDEPGCLDGEPVYIGDQPSCRVEVAAPVVEPASCPDVNPDAPTWVSHLVWGEPDDCHVVVPSIANQANCPDPWQSNDASCEVINETLNTTFPCPASGDGQNVFYTPGENDAGEWVVLRCFYADGNGVCPAGFDGQLNGGCARPVDEVIGAASCPPTWQQVGNQCEAFLRITPPPFGSPEDAKVCYQIYGAYAESRTSCRVHRYTLAPGQPTCPAMTSVYWHAGACKEWTMPLMAGCPAGSTVGGYGLCEQPIATTPATVTCPSGTALSEDETMCIRYDPQALIPTCAQDHAIEAGVCVATGEAPAQGPATCPAGDEFVGEPGACQRIVPAVLTCEAGAGLVDGSCRTLVDDVPGSLGCTESYALVGERCVRYEASVVTCAGRIVTINMNLGDSGIGTDGDDVILGTAGPDIIEGLGGKDFICAGAGDDDVRGGPGKDRIYGEKGNDRLRGNGGSDKLRGGAGDDWCNGGNGTDTASGCETLVKIE